METPSPWREGRDGRHAMYRERLRPPLVLVVVGVALAGVVGVAYGAAYGAAWGWLVGLALAGVVLAVLAATTVPLAVDDRVIRAGRARLPLCCVGEVTVLDRDEMVAARRHGDPRDYVVIRPWSARGGVAITLNDPRDPHPRWIVSSRHPDHMATAIRHSATGATPSAADG
jgi:hypothetical protein